MTEPSLCGRELAAWRADRCLFERLHFDLGPGQLALLVGSNGSGKTTLLRILAGLGLPTEGTVTWRGIAVGELAPDERGEIAYRGHLEALKRDLTVAENLEFHAAVWGRSRPFGDVLEELKRVPGANRAQVFGLPDIAMRVWLRPDRMAQLGISVQDVANAIQSQNETFGIGQLDGSREAAGLPVALERAREDVGLRVPPPGYGRQRPGEGLDLYFHRGTAGLRRHGQVPVAGSG